MHIRNYIIAAAFCLVFAVYAENIPKNRLMEIREYPEKIYRLVKPQGARKLSNDTYFLKILKNELKNKFHTSEEKVYYFYLMLRKFGWASFGTAIIRSPMNYVETVQNQCATYGMYRNTLSKLGFDSGDFFQLAFCNTEERPILASYSLLLGALLESDDQKIVSVLEQTYRSGLYACDSIFRPMLIHNVMLASSLVSGFEHALSLFQVIYETVPCWEEEKEDLVIAMMMTRQKESSAVVFHNLLEESNEENAFFVSTCLSLFQSVYSPEDFKAFVDYWESQETHSWKTAYIARLRESNYEITYYKDNFIPKGKTFTKTWDNVEVTVYDDGMLVSYKDRSEFFPAEE